MPIYEYYSPETNRIYSFYAKTLEQGRTVPRCPDRPGAPMVKLLSTFAVGGRRTEPASDAGDGPAGPDDARMEAALGAMERELVGADENDPRAVARMMRRMAQLTGETMDERTEEAVRRLEQGADPEEIEGEFGEAFGGSDPGDPTNPPESVRARRRRPPPVRDPKLYDFD